MSNEDMTIEELDELLFVANKKLIEAWENLDPKDPDYAEKAKALAALYKEVNADTKNRSENTLRVEENQTEKDRLEEDKRSNRKKEWLDIIGKIVLVGTTLFTGGTQIWMYKRSTRKESDEAILTQTDRTTVQNGLSGRWTGFLKK